MRPVHHTQSGNMLFMILIAIVLVGILTAAIFRTSNIQDASIDNETLAIRASEIQRYGGELERAVLYIVQNGISESDIRFAHPDAPSAYGDLSADTDKRDQIFDRAGGGASYRAPPSGINDGSPWEFYGGTAIPGMGTSKADLIAVLPNVTDQFCRKVNDMNGQATPADTGGSLAAGAAAGDCLSMGAAGRFGAVNTFYATPNTVNTASFAQDPEISRPRPAPQACVVCAADSKNHYYYVLMAR